MPSQNIYSCCKNSRHCDPKRTHGKWPNPAWGSEESMSKPGPRGCAGLNLIEGRTTQGEEIVYEKIWRQVWIFANTFLQVPRPRSSVVIQPPYGTSCWMLSNKWPHPCWDETWGHRKTLVMLAKFDTSFVKIPMLYSESLPRSLESWSPQGRAACGGSMLTHSQGRLSCGHLSLHDCLTGGDWLFLLCHQDVTGILSTWKHMFECRRIDWVPQKRQFERMQNMEWVRQSHWIWGKTMKEMKSFTPL